MSHWPDLSSSPAALEIPDGSLVQDQLVRREASPGTLRVFSVKQNAFRKTWLCCVCTRVYAWRAWRTPVW